MSGTKKKLKARHLPAQDKRPRCPLHPLVAMELNTEEARWECQMAGCVQIVFPKVVASAGRPIIGRGDLELLRFTDKDGVLHHYLRTMTGNVMIALPEDSIDNLIVNNFGYAKIALTVPLVDVG